MLLKAALKSSKTIANLGHELFVKKKEREREKVNIPFRDERKNNKLNDFCTIAKI